MVARERLQKVLARAGVASRRGAEELIAAGRVAVNGRDRATDMTQRDVAAAWATAIEAAGLPLAGSEGQRGRSRIAFGAPLPVGMTAERELIDVVLTDRWPVWRVREAMTPHLPEGWRLIVASSAKSSRPRWPRP